MIDETFFMIFGVLTPGRPGVANFLPLNYHWSTLLHMEVKAVHTPVLKIH